MRTTPQVTHRPITVMPGLVPGIHVLAGGGERTWMAGTGRDRPGHDDVGDRVHAIAAKLAEATSRADATSGTNPHHGHGRARRRSFAPRRCPGHPRAFFSHGMAWVVRLRGNLRTGTCMHLQRRTWIAGTGPAMTVFFLVRPGMCRWLSARGSDDACALLLNPSPRRLGRVSVP